MADASVKTFDMASPQFRPRLMSFGVTTGAAQVETVTAPAVAAATQGDFIIIYNQAGLSEALWLDIDADGTAPSADEYLAADTKTMVSVATGDLAAAVAAAIASAVTLADVTAAYVSGATFTLTQDIYGDCSDAVPYNEDASGAGSIGVSVGTQGLDAALGNGKFDAEVSQTAIGTYTVTFDSDKNYLRAPEVGVTVKSDNRIARVSASAVGSVTIELSNLVGGATADGNFSLLVLGSDAVDAIL